MPPQSDMYTFACDNNPRGTSPRLCASFFYRTLAEPVVLQVPGAGVVGDGHFEDAIDAVVQMGNNHAIIALTVTSVVAAGLLNWAAVHVTQRCGAGTRVVVDTTRTAVVWLTALLLSWEAFCWPQVRSRHEGGARS